VEITGESAILSNCFADRRAIHVIILQMICNGPLNTLRGTNGTYQYHVLHLLISDYYSSERNFCKECNSTWLSCLFNLHL